MKFSRFWFSAFLTGAIWGAVGLVDAWNGPWHGGLRWAIVIWSYIWLATREWEKRSRPVPTC